MATKMSAEDNFIQISGKTYPLSIIEGSEHERAFDIRGLRAETGLITFDPGYANSGSCESAITFIDGEEGILRYRGYPIEELAEHSSFLEICWLLIHGELPNQAQLTEFTESVTLHTMLHENFRGFFSSLPKCSWELR